MSFYFQYRRQEASKSHISHRYYKHSFPFRRSQKITMSQKAITCFEFGKSHHFRRGNLRQAIAEYTKAIEYEITYAEAWFYRGKAYYDLNEISQAIADYSKAITYKSDYVEAWFYRGKAHSDIKKIPQAINDYNVVIKYKPNYAEAWFYRGKAYHQGGNIDRAIADYTKAIEYNAEYPQAFGNRGFLFAKLYEKACFGEQLYHLDRALEDLQKAADIFKKQGNMTDYEKCIKMIDLYF